MFPFIVCRLLLTFFSGSFQQKMINYLYCFIEIIYVVQTNEKIARVQNGISYVQIDIPQKSIAHSRVRQ